MSFFFLRTKVQNLLLLALSIRTSCNGSFRSVPSSTVNLLLECLVFTCSGKRRYIKCLSNKRKISSTYWRLNFGPELVYLLTEECSWEPMKRLARSGPSCTPMATPSFWSYLEQLNTKDASEIANVNNSRSFDLETLIEELFCKIMLQNSSKIIPK